MSAVLQSLCVADGECDATKAMLVCYMNESCPGSGAAKLACEDEVAKGIAAAKRYGNGFAGCSIP